MPCRRLRFAEPIQRHLIASIRHRATAARAGARQRSLVTQCARGDGGGWGLRGFCLQAVEELLGLLDLGDVVEGAGVGDLEAAHACRARGSRRGPGGAQQGGEGKRESESLLSSCLGRCRRPSELRLVQVAGHGDRDTGRGGLAAAQKEWEGGGGRGGREEREGGRARARGREREREREREPGTNPATPEASQQT